MPRSYIQVQNEQLDRDIKGLISEVENTSFMQAGKLFANFARQQQITFELYDTSQNLSVVFENTEDYAVLNPTLLQEDNSIATERHEYMIVTRYNHTSYHISGLTIEEMPYSAIVIGRIASNAQFDEDLERLIAQIQNTNLAQVEELWAAFVRQYQEPANEHVLALILRNMDDDSTGFIVNDTFIRTYTDTESSVFARFDDIEVSEGSDARITKKNHTSYAISDFAIEGEILSILVAGLGAGNEELDRDLLNILAQMQIVDSQHVGDIWFDFLQQQQKIVSPQEIAMSITDGSYSMLYLFEDSSVLVLNEDDYTSTAFVDLNAVLGNDVSRIVPEIGSTNYIVTELLIDGDVYSLELKVNPENGQFDVAFQNLISQVQDADFTQAKKLFATFARQQSLSGDLQVKEGTVAYKIRDIVIGGQWFSLQIPEFNTENEELGTAFESLIAQMEGAVFSEVHELLADFARQQQVALTFFDSNENLSIVFDTSQFFDMPTPVAFEESAPVTMTTTEGSVIENTYIELNNREIRDIEEALAIETETNGDFEVMHSTDDYIVVTSEGSSDSVKSSDQSGDVAPEDTYVTISANEVYSIAAEIGNSTSNYEALIEGKIYLLIVTGLSTEVVNQISFVLKNILPWIIVCMAGLSFFIAFFLSKTITNPIKKLNLAATQIADLSFNIHCDEKRTDELGQLAKNINFLSSKLHTTLTSLQDEVEHEKMLEEKQRLFFAAASHELKTPLTIIKGNLEGMFYGYKEYQDKDTYISSSLRTTCDMEKLINEILHVSQLDAKGMKLQLTTINVKNLIDDIVENYREIIELKNFTLTCQLDNVSRKVDKALFIKALQNILGNAFHYSPDGAQITISLSEKSILVENFGITLAKEEIEKVFEPFYRVEKSRNRQTGGSGLGLYFVKAILDQHKVPFSMTSKPNSIVFEILL